METDRDSGYCQGDPGGPGYGGLGRQVRRRRHPLTLSAAAAVLAIAAGLGSSCSAKSAEPASNTASPSPSRPLTTSQIATAVDPGLVDINTTLGYQNAAAAGTGMVLTPSGEVLTNNHVVEGATSISVTDVGSGQTYKATAVGYDQSGDVAVLQLRGASGLKTAPLGNSSAVTVGQRVVGVGNAGGKGGMPRKAPGSVTGLNQTITATDRASGTSEQLTGLIQVNAPIQPGDSGGPLVSTTGQVIGMDTAASSSYQLKPSGPKKQTQGFAIPVNTAQSVAGQIEAGRASSTVQVGPTGFLGVELATPSAVPGTGTGKGALVVGVVPGGPAARLGLGAGDTITSLGGQTVTSPSSVQKVINKYRSGDKVSIGWTDQARQRHSGTVTLASGPVG